MRVLLGLVLILWPVLVWADGCTQYTVMVNGQMKMCQSCCYGGMCQVSCL